MTELTESILSEIKEHINLEAPKEACGLVTIFKGKLRYIRCKNLSKTKDTFQIDPEEWAQAEDTGTIEYVVHSHVYLPPVASQADLVGCETTGVPWLIINFPNYTQSIIVPKGYKAPLTGRVFAPGILDCYSIIKDYYKEVVGIEIPNFHRPDRWWEGGLNLYLDNYEKANFVQVNDEFKLHDVLFMQVGSSVPNHAAIWLANGKILHHQTGRLSSEDVYGGWYQKITCGTYRHKDLL